MKRGRNQSSRSALETFGAASAFAPSSVDRINAAASPRKGLQPLRSLVLAPTRPMEAGADTVTLWNGNMKLYEGQLSPHTSCTVFPEFAGQTDQHSPEEVALAMLNKMHPSANSSLQPLPGLLPPKLPNKADRTRAAQRPVTAFPKTPKRFTLKRAKKVSIQRWGNLDKHEESHYRQLLLNMTKETPQCFPVLQKIFDRHPNMVGFLVEQLKGNTLENQEWLRDKFQANPEILDQYFEEHPNLLDGFLDQRPAVVEEVMQSKFSHSLRESHQQEMQKLKGAFEDELAKTKQNFGREINSLKVEMSDKVQQMRAAASENVELKSGFKQEKESLSKEMADKIHSLRSSHQEELQTREEKHSVQMKEVETAKTAAEEQIEKHKAKIVELEARIAEIKGEHSQEKGKMTLLIQELQEQLETQVQVLENLQNEHEEAMKEATTKAQAQLQEKEDELVALRSEIASEREKKQGQGAPAAGGGGGGGGGRGGAGGGAGRQPTHAAQSCVQKQHVWNKYFKGSTKDNGNASPTHAMSLKVIQVLIYNIYEAKINADETTKLAGGEVQPLADFVQEYFLILHGSKKAVKAKLVQLMDGLSKHAPKSPFVAMFKRCCGFMLGEGEAAVDPALFQTLLHSIDVILKSAVPGSKSAALGLDLDKCDNQERHAIKAAGGDALVATMRLSPSLNLLGDFMRQLQLAPSNAQKALEGSAFAIKGQQFISFVTFVEIYTVGLLEHDANEKERLHKVFAIADADGSGDIDLQEFKDLLLAVPGLTRMSQYEVTRMFMHAVEEGHDDAHDDASAEEWVERESTMSETQFVKLAQGKMKQALSREILSMVGKQLQSKEAQYQNMLSGHVKVLFDKFDPHQSGQIPLDKFPALMEHVGRKMSPEQLVRALALVNVDGNDGIEFNEFLEWWRDYSLNETFLQFDKDGSGSLERSELRELLESMGLEFEFEGEFEKVFDEIDTDHQGQASFAELVSWFSVFDARKTFAKFDLDGSGTIETDELARLFNNLGMYMSPEALDEAMLMIDGDGSGSLSFEEFLPFWTVMQRDKKHAKEDESAAHTMRRRSLHLDLKAQNKAYLKLAAHDEKAKYDHATAVTGLLAQIAVRYNIDVRELNEMSESHKMSSIW